MRLERDVAADGIKLTLQTVDAPTVEGERHDAVLPVQLGDLVRDDTRISGRPDRRNETELRPRAVGGMVLLATLLQIARKPAVEFRVKNAGSVLVDDRQGAQITGSAEIKSSIDANADGNIGLATASAPGGRVDEPRLGSNALVQNQIPERVFARRHTLRLFRKPFDVRERTEVTERRIGG